MLIFLNTMAYDLLLIPFDPFANAFSSFYISFFCTYYLVNHCLWLAGSPSFHASYFLLSLDDFLKSVKFRTVSFPYFSPSPLFFPSFLFYPLLPFFSELAYWWGLSSAAPPPPATVHPCPPLTVAEEEHNLYSASGVLSFIQSTTRRAYQQVLEVLDENPRR